MLLRTRGAPLIVVVAALACRGGAPTETSGPPPPPPSGEASTAKTGWFTVIGGGGQDEAHGIAMTSDGLFIAGTHDGAIEAPDGVTQGHGLNDAFVAKLSRDGKLSWLRTYGSPQHDRAWSVAATSAGPIVAIETGGTLVVGTTPTRTPEQERRDETPPVLLGIDGQGKHAWIKSLDGEAGAMRAVASHGDEVVAAGWSLIRSGPRDLGTA